MSLDIPEAVGCRDVHCKDKNHRDDIDKYVKEILEAVNESGKESIPTPPSRQTKKVRRKKTVGWKELVEPYQDGAHFWHSVWVSAGKPMNTELHKIMKHSRNRYHCQIRKCRRVENYLRNQKIIENCVENDTDLFSEIRKQRKNNNTDEVTIDGASGEEIPGRFATIYNELFNRGKDDDKIDAMKIELERGISRDDVSETDRINSEVIKEAMKQIKGNKSDAIYDFSSDFLKHGPDILYEHLANIMKTFAVHGHISEHLLVATLVPLVKDKLGDLCSSKNYRSIAISSLILKLLDWILIINYGHLLKNNDFQFGFQPFSNTSLCSWVVYETIDHYLRNGSIIYGCLLDCSKAFDTIEHSKLFEKLLNAGMPKLFIRLLMFMYRNQTANVRWKNKMSQEFNIRNGVRQGAVISPLFFNFYMDNLFSILKSINSGCLINNYFAGCIGYADDLLFLCPSRSGLQEMLEVAQDYVQEHQISFSTHQEPTKSKTKGIIFSKGNLRFSPAPLRLNGNDLPWIESAKYLGNTITNMLDGYSRDCKQKRAMYIGRNCELLQEFHHAHPEVKCRINRIYNTSFPGSVLWDYRSEMFNQIVNSWSVSIRHMWELPHSTTRHLIEPLGGQHVYTMILARYVKFIQSISKSSKLAVRYLLQKVMNNYNTQTGNNIRFILNKVGAEDIMKVKVEDVKKVKFCENDDDHTWKVNLIREITNIKHNVLSVNQAGDFLTDEDLEEILSFVCTS